MLISFKGAPVKPPQFSSISSATGNLKPILLYTISLHADKNSRPVFQILSQRHTSDFISYFMKHWRHQYNNMKNPHEIIMDNSNALILASVQSFTSLSTTNAYLNACFDMLFDEVKPNVKCFIRLDRSHIVKQIMRMKQIALQDRRVTQLLRHVLGFLITVEDIKTARDIISKIFILLFNKYEHIEEVTQAKWTLKTIMDYHETPNIDEIHDDNNSNIDNDVCDVVESVESKFKCWIKEIISEVREKFIDEKLNESVDAETQKSLNIVENIYYVKDEKHNLENSLINFLSIIPLWSNIMLRSFDSKNTTATSSPTEASFKNLETVIFKNESGIRVDVFVEKYLQYLTGTFKHLLAQNKSQQNKEFTENIENNENNSLVTVVVTPNKSQQCEQFTENIEIVESNSSETVEVSQEIWRDKNVDVIKPRKPVRKNRILNSILEKSRPYSANIPILPNGSTTIGNNRKPTIISHNTCPFDVFYQVYAAFYKDVEQFPNRIDNSEKSFDIFIKTSFGTKTTRDLIEHRDGILFSIFPERVVDCEENTKTIDV